ncbi:MAG: proton-conducting transporter membrane subunit [Planctomycetota bacterium]|nr:proton-conducting transporter membrane subunit [Planctomycetota bacterium]
MYGLVRMLSLLPDPPATWGAIILFMAAVSALLGVAFAIAQHDLKRLLAYHSVENIGIILMGLGLAMLGRSLHRTDWVVLGMAGCLLHVWNHSFFKSLLFFCAGSVLHGAHTLQTDRLGGLAKAMPQTALLFLVGAVAICGLPPLNGFVSELLVYLGLLRGLTTPTRAGSAAAMAAPVLAMVGALALACFVKVYGAVFLGQARSAQAARAHEAPLSMRAPAMIGSPTGCPPVRPPPHPWATCCPSGPSVPPPSACWPRSSWPAPCCRVAAGRRSARSARGTAATPAPPLACNTPLRRSPTRS